MKKFVVGYLTFFENELKLFKVESDSEYSAIKETMVLACSKEEYKQDEIDWQNSEDYPQDKESLIEMLYNSDIVIEVIEI